jgi:Condensation domain
MIHMASLDASARRASMIQLTCSTFCLQVDTVLNSVPMQLWSIDAVRHILLVSMHHSITDGLSITIMKAELAAAYAAACSGTQPGWQQLPVQFADYAAWQRSNLQLDEELAWWSDTLAGAPPLLELPYDRPRPDVFSHKGAHVQLALADVTASDLAELAAQHQTTPFVVALTALQVLL